ncbi:MAG: lactate racemase domain-containing protein [Pseudomonadota bacterium]
MTLLHASGGPDAVLGDDAIASALLEAIGALGAHERIAIVPPDFTRRHSRAGLLTDAVCERYGDRVADVLPALGTHAPMTVDEIREMYPGVPLDRFREHRWRDDVVDVGEVPADFVAQATEGIWRKPWPVQMNRLLWEGGHDLLLSIGQVVPHEVMGMANYNKNIFIGTGGSLSINESHFIGAAYGMERMMGRADTPLRRILNRAQDAFCAHLPLVYALTVIGSDDRGELVTRGFFVGDDHECFERAAELSVLVNVTRLPAALDKVVVSLPADEFKTTWLGNKAIYRTRMALADEAELIVLAPGVAGFGEDAEIDRLIRRYGYRTTPEIMAAMADNADLQANLSAAAHLIHGSSEGRFRVTYAPGRLSRADIEGVGYGFGDLEALSQRYHPRAGRTGWQTTAEGEDYFYIDNPALGLWAATERLSRAR